MAEEQPGRPLAASRHVLLQKRPERRDAGAWADHDDGRIAIGRQSEIMGALDIGLDLVAGPQSRAREGRGGAKPLAPAYCIAHVIDRKSDPPWSRLVRGGDRIESWLQRLQNLDEGLWIWPKSCKFFDRRQHIECRGIAVWVPPLGQGFRLCPADAAGDVGDKFEQHVRREA